MASQSDCENPKQIVQNGTNEADHAWNEFKQAVQADADGVHHQEDVEAETESMLEVCEGFEVLLETLDNQLRALQEGTLKPQDRTSALQELEEVLETMRAKQRNEEKL